MRKLIIIFGIVLWFVSFFSVISFAHHKGDKLDLVQFIIQNEGYEEHIYKDTRGYLTVGYGHKLPNNGKYKVGQPIHPDQLDKWFHEDLTIAVNCAKRFFDRHYNNTEFVVIADMAFNLGCKTLNDFWRLRKHLNNKDYHMASKAIVGSTYYKQVKNRASINAALIKSIGGK